MAEISKQMLRVLKARQDVARRNVFFASIVYVARLIEDKTIYVHGSKTPTMATDGLNIFFHPDFVDGVPDEELRAVVLHEVLHCAFTHPARKQHREHIKWNCACDFAINPLVSSVYKLPKGALMDPKYADKTAEMIYEVLEDMQKKSGGLVAEASGRMREATPEEMEAHERLWRQTVKVAAEKAEKAGQLSGELRRLIEEIFPSDKLDWRSLIDDMAHEAKSRTVGSWSHPNRRYLGSGAIWPGDVRDQVYRLVVCIDSSGSVTEEQLKAMKSEVMSLLDQNIVTNVTMISTDTKVCNMQDVDTSEDVRTFDLGPHGGGTDFTAAMDVVAQVPDACGCVFLTDMMTNSFGKEPPFPVVFIDWLNGSSKAPYGQTAHYEA